MKLTTRMILVFLFCLGNWQLCCGSSPQNVEQVEIGRLRIQCCNAAMPWYGLGNMGWPSAVYFVARNADQPDIKEFLNATDDQIKKIKAANLDDEMPIDFVDQLRDIAEDTPEAKELWSLFRPDQLWKLDLVRLKTEGLAALRIDSISKHLQLDETQRLELTRKIQQYRRDHFLPQFARGFASSSTTQGQAIEAWFFTQKTIEFNLQVLDSLNPKQQFLLAKMFQEFDDNRKAALSIQNVALEAIFSPKK